MTRSKKAYLSRTEIVRQEMEDQQNMQVRAERLARFRAATEGKVWCRNAKTGEWYLVSVPTMATLPKASGF